MQYCTTHGPFTAWWRWFDSMHSKYIGVYGEIWCWTLSQPRDRLHLLQSIHSIGRGRYKHWNQLDWILLKIWQWSSSLLPEFWLKSGRSLAEFWPKSGWILDALELHFDERVTTRLCWPTFLNCIRTFWFETRWHASNKGHLSAAIRCQGNPLLICSCIWRWRNLSKSIIVEQLGNVHQMLCSLSLIIRPSQTLYTILFEAMGGALSIPVSRKHWLQP